MRAAPTIGPKSGFAGVVERLVADVRQPGEVRVGAAIALRSWLGEEALPILHASTAETAEPRLAAAFRAVLENEKTPTRPLESLTEGTSISVEAMRLP